jgi:hypothetical protein
MKYVARLEDLHDRAVFVVGGFQAIHGLMQMRIELLSDRIDALSPELGEVFDELLVDQLKTLAINLLLLLTVRRQRMLEPVDDGYQPLNQPRRRALGILRAFLLDALAIVVEIGLSPQQRLPQIVKLAEKFRGLRIIVWRIGLCIPYVHGWLRVATGFIALHADIAVLVQHFLASPLPKVSQILLSVSLNNCAT